MKHLCAASLVAAAAASGTSVSPIDKVIQMISDLQAKVIGEGEVAQKEYDKYSEWCEDNSRNLANEIKTQSGEVEALQATIEEETSHIAELKTKIEELAASLAQDEEKLASAKAVRAKEKKAFLAEEAELDSTIEVIGKAMTILEKEMAKGGASMLQLKNAGNLAQALGALVQASAINSADATRLSALVQQDADDEDDTMGAPAAAAYEGKSGGIVDTLSDLLEKAEAELANLRKKEQAEQHNFEMVAQGLTDSIKFANKDSDASKKSLAESEEAKSVATGDLGVTSKALAEDVAANRELHHDCMTKAEDFEAETKSRGEELGALKKAKAIIIEATGGAASLLQISEEGEGSKNKVVRFVRDLGKKYNSPALAQLASRMASSMRLGRGDVFAKVKGLITDMISKLEGEAKKAATEKAFCDDELAESNAKQEELSTAVDKLTTKIDQDTARAGKLKEEVADLQNALAELATSQAKMDDMRSEEKATFTQNEAETAKGLDGVKKALTVLRDYYANSDKGHSSSDGAAGGIVSMLEVCESDMSKSLAEMRTVEDAAASEYEVETQSNKMEKLSKSKDVEYKTKEAKSLAKTVSEASADRKGVQSELDAVNEYLTSLKARCIGKAESYADRTAAREAEVAGLKEALTILESQAALLQQSGRSLRGVSRH